MLVMRTIGLIGSGNIGGTVARLAVAAGHQVVLSNSRGPETLAELVAELGPRARAATAEQAATAASDLVVVAIPFKAVTTLPTAALAGKTVIDTGNYYPARAGSLSDSWRQQPGTPVYGPPYGTFDNEKGQPAGEDVIRADLAAATR